MSIYAVLNSDSICTGYKSKGNPETDIEFSSVGLLWDGAAWQAAPVKAVPAVRKISTGAMQRRFTITEEVFIASDAAATVIKSRLINASYCDLDFEDTADGIDYICGILKAGGVIVDAVTRAAELLTDGTQDEKA